MTNDLSLYYLLHREIDPVGSGYFLLLKIMSPDIKCLSHTFGVENHLQQTPDDANSEVSSPTRLYCLIELILSFKFLKVLLPPSGPPPRTTVSIKICQFVIGR